MVFDRVLVRPVVDAGTGEARVVEVAWAASGAEGRAVQIYVDGELCEVSADARGATWLVLDGGRSHRVELLAVSRERAWVSHERWLGSWGDGAALAVVRDEAWPTDARVVVRVDGEVAEAAALWPGDASRSGFGALFGEGGFGVDAATGPGLGGGELGMGPLGADGTAWRWRGSELPAGEHALEVALRGEGGAVLGEVADAGTVTVARLPRGATAVRMDGDFTLRWLAEGEVW